MIIVLKYQKKMVNNLNFQTKMAMMTNNLDQTNNICVNNKKSI